MRPCWGQLQGHKAAQGEDLFTIARRYKLALEHLAFANGFPITTLDVAPGTELIVPTWRVLPARPPRDGVVVNLPERGFYLFRGGQCAGFYPISIGDELKDAGRFFTRPGEFRILEKVKDPVWYPPAWAGDTRPVPAGPQNPLGDRWIGLTLPRTGIHGTNDPLNIGNSVTHGCMRMYPELVREVYDKVEVGWPVRIEYETAKLGRTAQGALVAVTFPDVYGLSDPVKSMRRWLRQAHAEGSVGRANFDSVAELAMGFPVEVAARSTVAQEVARRLKWESP